MSLKTTHCVTTANINYLCHKCHWKPLTLSSLSTNISSLNKSFPCHMCHWKPLTVNKNFQYQKCHWKLLIVSSLSTKLPGSLKATHCVITVNKNFHCLKCHWKLLTVSSLSTKTSNVISVTGNYSLCHHCQQKLPMSLVSLKRSCHGFCCCGHSNLSHIQLTSPLLFRPCLAQKT